MLKDLQIEALAILVQLTVEYPSLIDGTDKEINGADFLDSVAREINDSEELVKYLFKFINLKG